MADDALDDTPVDGSDGPSPGAETEEEGVPTPLGHGVRPRLGAVPLEDDVRVVRLVVQVRHEATTHVVAVRPARVVLTPPHADADCHVPSPCHHPVPPVRAHPKKVGGALAPMCHPTHVSKTTRHLYHGPTPDSIKRCRSISLVSFGLALGS